MAAAGIGMALEIKKAMDEGLNAFDHVSKLYDSAIGAYERLEGAIEFEDRTRSLELSIINGTKHTLRYCDAYFDSGTFFVHPQPVNIPASDAAIAYVANRQGSVATGVTGGLDYEIEGSGGYHLYLGFCNPFTGSYKLFIAVEKGKSAEWAYDNSYDDSLKSIKKNGYYFTATMHEGKRSPYKLFQYAISDQ